MIELKKFANMTCDLRHTYYNILENMKNCLLLNNHHKTPCYFSKTD